jgi:hypothetical protein
MVLPVRSATSMSIQHVCRWVLHRLGLEQSFFSPQATIKKTTVNPLEAIPDMKLSSDNSFVIAAVVGSASVMLFNLCLQNVGDNATSHLGPWA